MNSRLQEGNEETLTYTKLLERKGEILKRTVETWIMKENRDGLDRQEAHIYRNMVKELHQNEQELGVARVEERVEEMDKNPDSDADGAASAKRELISQGV